MQAAASRGSSRCIDFGNESEAPPVNGFDEALRLAKEAADLANPPAPKVKAKRVAKAKVAKKG